MAKPPLEIFTPPNILKAKLGGTIVGLDMAAIARGEAAIEELSIEFIDWMRTGAEDLAQIRASFGETPDAGARQKLYCASQNLKTQALTLGSKLVARAATSLCELLEVPISPPPSLLDAHVDAIRALVREDRTHEDEATASRLVKELEQRTAEVRREQPIA